jgi:putative membrane protein
MKFTALWRAMLPVTVAVASLTAACEGRTDDESMDGAYENRDQGTQVQPPAMEPAGALTDEDIISQVRLVNMSDSALGRLAQQKGTKEEVRDFGERMQNEHHSAQEQVNEVAQKLNITTSDNMSTWNDTQNRPNDNMRSSTPGMQSSGLQAMQRQAQQMRDSLQRMPKSAEWDRAYINHEVSAHEQALELLTRAENSTQRQELRDLVGKLTPVVQDHLEKARELQRELQEDATS